MELTNKQYLRVLEKMCQIIKVDFKVFFKPVIERQLGGDGKYKMPKEWYRKHTWTDKQQVEYQKWLCDYLYKIHKGIYNRVYCNKYAAFFVFDYGWVVKDKETK